MRSASAAVFFTATAIVIGASSVAQNVPDYSGTWILDVARSGPRTDVWGQTRAEVIIAKQSPEELTLVTEGGGLAVPQALQRYRLDGVAHTFRDVSLGDLPNFVRKVRTEARWDGRALTLETEPFSESLERTGVTTTRRGITSVLRLRLELDGHTLAIERTGFRAEPPQMLHGRPYSKSDDLVYNIDRVVYAKRAR